LANHVKRVLNHKLMIVLYKFWLW